jgi:hypothetical protein
MRGGERREGERRILQSGSGSSEEFKEGLSEQSERRARWSIGRRCAAGRHTAPGDELGKSSRGVGTISSHAQRYAGVGVRERERVTYGSVT